MKTLYHGRDRRERADFTLTYSPDHFATRLGNGAEPSSLYPIGEVYPALVGVRVSRVWATYSNGYPTGLWIEVQDKIYRVHYAKKDDAGIYREII